MKLLDELIENPFDLERFKKSADLFFAGQAADEALMAGKPLKESLLSSYSGYISDFCSIKRFILSEGATVAVLAVRTVQDAFDEQNGYIQRKLMSEILSSMRCDAAVAAFYGDGTPEWKLSFIRLLRKNDEPGVLRVNNGFRLSRVSFILGSGDGCGTAAINRTSINCIVSDAARKQLLKLIQKKEQTSLKHLEKTFSYKIFARNLIRGFSGRYADTTDLSAMVKLPGFRMHESDPYDRILAMDPEMLGKLFESSFGRKDRKNRGTFYTPSEIVSFMCRESLAQYISNAVELPYGDCLVLLDTEGPGCDHGSDPGSSMFRELVSRLPGTISRSLYKIGHALRQVRIFDPAAGSGAFAMGMLKEIVKARVTVSACISAGIPDDLYMLALHAVRNCIFAADIDEEAVRMTRLRLWCALASLYESGLRGHPGLSELTELAKLLELPGLPSAQGAFCNVVCGNSLDISAEQFKNLPPFANVIAEKGGFDIVIGNPPYISAVEDAKDGNSLRHYLKSKYPILRGSFDIYTAFLLEGVSQINGKGIYCWIVPNSLLSSRYASPVLEYLKKNGLKRSISVSDVNVFHNVGVYPVIVIGNKKASDGEYEEYIAASAEDPGHAVIRHSSCSERYTSPNGVRTFKDFGIRFASGTAGFQAKALTGCITEECVEGAIPFVVSGSIDKYSVGYNNVRYMGRTYERPYITKSRYIAQSKWELWRNEKIVIAGLTRELEADYCREPLALGVGAYALYDFGGFDPLFLLGLLNSRFMSEYINEQFHEKHLAGGYLAINKSTLEQLPLVSADPELQKTIAEKAAGVKSLMRQFHGDLTNADRSNVVRESLLRDIDGLVDRLYGR